MSPILIKISGYNWISYWIHCVKSQIWTLYSFGLKASKVFGVTSKNGDVIIFDSLYIAPKKKKIQQLYIFGFTKIRYMIAYHLNIFFIKLYQSLTIHFQTTSRPDFFFLNWTLYYIWQISKIKIMAI